MRASPATGDSRVSRVFFDLRDHELLGIVNDIARRRDIPGHRRLFAPYLHPHGIKEMAAQRGLRIAYAVAHLLGSLEIGRAADRLAALRSLKEEVLYTSQGSLRVNAARVLIEIMKNLLRSGDDPVRQLELAHDFRAVAAGRPRVVREQLKRYHLLEMPEEWNQVTFDDHVHDANTKGRKTPTHLVMDAWIKGIRRLTVIYYNHVPREAAEELLEAAAVMDIKVRIGIEFFARFRNRFIKLIWVPRGLKDPQGFLAFLDTPQVQSLMARGRHVSGYHQGYVLEVLRAFGRTHRRELEARLGLPLPPLDEAGFLAFVGAGQTSIQHLGRYIHDRLLPLLRDHAASLRARFETAPAEERRELEAQVRFMDGLGVHEIVEQYLRPGRNPGLPDPEMPPAPGPGVPELLALTAPALLDILYGLHPKHRVILNLDNLTSEDVLELVYDCRGRITHLELLNLRNRTLGREFDTERIHALMEAVNCDNIVKMKRFISTIIEAIDCRLGDGHCDDRRDKLVEILYDLQALRTFYRDKPLKASLGSDSTGQSGGAHGMGLVMLESLPRHVQRQIESGRSGHERLPVAVEARDRVTRSPMSASSRLLDMLLGLTRHVPGLRSLGCDCTTDWLMDGYSPATAGGNLYALGGTQPPEGNGLRIEDRDAADLDRRIPMAYLNTGLKIFLKIMTGFIPAFLAFSLTKDWWLLAYGGAAIWFAITGLRNVIQSVLGCGGFHRSSLVTWTSLVSWNRLADSLLFTGFSVPLLDWLVKTQLLERTFGVTTTTNPVLLYAAMSLVNGLYLASHNLIRGLPRAAVVGNLFRSLFAIPLALAFNGLAGEILALAGAAAPQAALQKWAAIISKLASDCVAGVIEGFADRAEYLRLRQRDYSTKLGQLFDVYARLELLYPLEDVLSLLESPEFIETLESENREVLDIAVVNGLDLQYFWMYQPRARSVLARLVREMSAEERQVFLLSQGVLARERQVSQLFLDGLVGKNFSKALAFYLDHWREYLDKTRELAASPPPATALEPGRSEAPAAA